MKPLPPGLHTVGPVSALKLPSLLLLLLHRPGPVGHPQGWPPMLQSPGPWPRSGKPGFRCLFHAINCVTLGELVSLSEPQFPCGAKKQVV